MWQSSNCICSWEYSPAFGLASRASLPALCPLVVLCGGTQVTFRSVAESSKQPIGCAQTLSRGEAWFAVDLLWLFCPSLEATWTSVNRTPECQFLSVPPPRIPHWCRRFRQTYLSERLDLPSKSSWSLSNLPHQLRVGALSTDLPHCGGDDSV